MNNKFDIGEAIGKTYNLEIAYSINDVNGMTMTPRSLWMTYRKRIQNAKLIDVNGYFLGQAYFTVDEKLLIVPWCYIISMIPC